MTNRPFEPLFTFKSKKNNFMNFKCNLCPSEKSFISVPSISLIVPWLKKHISKWHLENLEQFEFIVGNIDIMAELTLMEQNAVHEQKNIDENEPFKAHDLDKATAPSWQIILPPLHIDKHCQFTTHKKEKSSEPIQPVSSIQSQTNNTPNAYIEKRQLMPTLIKSGLTVSKTQPNDGSKSSKSPKENIKEKSAIEKVTLERKGSVKENITEQLYACKMCNKSFDFHSNLKRHTESVHEGKKRHKCTHCDKAFAGKSDLQRHISGVHDKIKPFQCSICGASFTEKGKLKTHIACVHEGKKAFKCSICNKDFKQNGHLKSHIEEVHDGKKPFQCSICPSTFSRNTQLKRHISAVHDKVKPFQCSECGATFAENGKLKSHISKNHEGKLKQHVEAVHEEKKRHKCIHCDKDFESKKDLQR